MLFLSGLLEIAELDAVVQIEAAFGFFGQRVIDENVIAGRNENNSVAVRQAPEQVSDLSRQYQVTYYRLRSAEQERKGPKHKTVEHLSAKTSRVRQSGTINRRDE